MSVLPQDIRETARGLDPRGIVIQAEHDSLDPGIFLQHPEHGLLRSAAEGYIAVFPPSLRIEGQEGQQVNGRLEHIEPAAVSKPVKTATGIAALHIPAEAVSLGVEAPLMGVAGSAVFVTPNEYGIMIFLRPCP